MKLEEIYQPIADDLRAMDGVLETSVRESKNRSIQVMSNSLLKSGGKKLRPALVILSEKATSAGKKSNCKNNELIMLASAVELIHLASLVHDDVLDGATMRRCKPSINSELGDDISIIFGDYIYSKAFDLIGKCRNPDVFECISQAIHSMCEGEFIQVFQRGNLNLSKESYITIVRKKTASLLAACCQAGSILGNHNQAVQKTLKGFGLNFGIAFQIIDDCKDLISEQRILGKHPGQDMIAGDMTLPLLDLLDAVGETEQQEIKEMFKSKIDQHRLEQIREMFLNSNAFSMTKQTAFYYINQAKSQLDELEDSDYKRSLECLADYIIPEALFNPAR